MRRSAKWGIVVVLALIGIGAAVVHHKIFRWKRFHTVEAGVLYRSGILKDWQLRAAIERYHLKTVFSFTHTNHEAEKKTCADAGIQRYFHYLPGDGVGTDDPYLKFLEVMEDPANHPVLVHCSAGVQRTGGAVALYRVIKEGWSFDEAIDEMIQKGNEGKEKQIKQLRQLVDRLAAVRPAAVADRRDSIPNPDHR